MPCWSLGRHMSLASLFWTFLQSLIWRRREGQLLWKVQELRSCTSGVSEGVYRLPHGESMLDNEGNTKAEGEKIENSIN